MSTPNRRTQSASESDTPDNAADAPAVRMRGLRVVRGGNVVIHEMDLDIAAGRVTGLFGPSGCGKTTLMRAIVGSQRDVTGEITVLGQRAGTASLRSEVGYVTQAPSVYTDLTARENLGYFARVVGAPTARVQEVISTVGLDEHADRPAQHLSGGQRARVSLGVALLGTPRLLVLDEPTVGLDPLIRQELWAEFHRLAGEGVTLLVSSHVMDEAAQCDDLLLLREGRVVSQSSPAQLLAQTGAADMSDAFLRIIERDEVAA